MRTIDRFRGRYFFLSNFFECDLTIEGTTDNGWPYIVTFPSAEHAYCYAKAIAVHETKIAQLIQRAASPLLAKCIGRAVSIPPDHPWWARRPQVMAQIIAAKFQKGMPLASDLISTHPAILIEGNSWGDMYWGQCPIGNGDNHLGKILMAHRDHLRTAVR